MSHYDDARAALGQTRNPDTEAIVSALLAVADAIRPPASERTVDLGEPDTPGPGRTTFSGPQLIWMPDPEAATIDITADPSRWIEAIKRAAATPWPTPVFDEPAPAEPKYTRDGKAYCPDCGVYLDQLPHFDDCKWGGRDADKPVEPPRYRPVYIEPDADEYRPCTEGRGGEAWPK